MPTLTTQLLLDLLLGVIILLFIPFGIRRGVAKEAIVSAGIFLGALLAQGWAEVGGAWLRRLLPLDDPVAAFIVALAALLGGTFVIGYGAGGALGNLRPGPLGRLAGGLLAAMNGALFLAYLLRFIETYLRPDGSLAGGIVTGALMQRFDLLLLIASGVLLVLIVIGWIVHATRGDRMPADALAPPRQRPLRTAASADSGKYEPVASHRRATPVSETAPLPEPVMVSDEAWRQSPAANGHAAVEAEWSMGPGEAAPAGRPTGTAAATWASWGSGGTGERFGASADPAGEGRRRCPTCGSLAGANDQYCPQCGKTL
ncbi:MAG: CvpA family protein [Thermomicrobiales bacterium]|nr:CvpA family protein [Thermomicrobiales bacterium]